MKKIIFIILFVILLISTFILFNPFGSREKTVVIKPEPDPTPVIKTNLPSNADKIEVFSFHATQRCISCVNLGQYSQETINEKFASEVNSGQIVFKEVNIDMAENRELAKEYGVSGSSLFITVTKDGQSYKEQDFDVWRYVTNKTRFTNYFEAKIKALL